MIEIGYMGKHTFCNVDACRLQFLNALPVYFGVGIAGCNDNATNTALYQLISTRRCFSMMRTGFQRDINRRAARTLPGLRQRICLSMRSATGRCYAPPNNNTVFYHHATD